MDRILEIKQLHRETTEKIYSQKAQNKSNEMKELTGVPQIDPFSRKLAEIVTQRELAALGIVPAKSNRPLVIPKKIANSLLPTPEKSPEMQFPVTEFEKLSQTHVTETKDTPKESPEKPSFPANTQNPPIKILESQADPVVVRLETDDILKAAENIQAFQDELQREYPELCLNIEDSSSVHTNDLNELEEACKEIEFIQSQENKEKKEDTQTDSQKKIYLPEEPEILEKKLLHESREIPKKPQNLRILKTSFSAESNRMTQRSSVGFGSWDKGGRTDTTALTNQTPEAVKKQVIKLHEVRKKQEFLHREREGAQKSIPRCHVNLKLAKMSPIFLNSFVPEGGKLKFDNKIVDVDALRALLIKESLQEHKKKSQNFYEKNEKWLRKKEKKLDRIRKAQEKIDIEFCTFEPELGKKKGNRKKGKILRGKKGGNRAVKEVIGVSESVGKRLGGKKEVLKYVGLSPAEVKVGYEVGGYGKRVESLGKPLISYRSINGLL